MKLPLVVRICCGHFLSCTERMRGMRRALYAEDGLKPDA